MILCRAAIPAEDVRVVDAGRICRASAGVKGILSQKCRRALYNAYI